MLIMQAKKPHMSANPDREWRDASRRFSQIADTAVASSGLETAPAPCSGGSVGRLAEALMVKFLAFQTESAYAGNGLASLKKESQE